jgi:hypothetical protein
MLRALCSGRRELGSFGELEDADLRPQVRLFFEEVIREVSDQEIRVADGHAGAGTFGEGTGGAHTGHARAPLAA